ncbi:MAG: TraB/GumN family protein [Rhodothermaceae bacterium]|nr:TraB/GumN family protein [Rhodothermaceae bacterium]
MNLHIRIVLFIAIAGLFTHSSVAQDVENTLLWKVEGKDIKPSYVFGTLHLLPQSDFLLKKKVENAFMETDLLVLELDMDDPGLQAETMKHANMKEGQTLDQLFTPDEYAAIDTELKTAMGVSLQMFNTFKPFVISAFFVAKLVGEQPASFEASLMTMAKAQGNEVEGLETVAEQMAMFDRFPYEDQADDIVEMISDMDKTRSIYRQLVDLYKEEDLEGLSEMMDEYFNGPNEKDILLIERNQKWIPMMESIAKKQSTFFGVGAGHLGGDQGVIALLKRAGYTVTPVMQ